MHNNQPEPDVGQPLERRFDELTEPFRRFISNQISGAILLVLATLAALIVANSPLQEWYRGLGELETGLFFQHVEIRKTLHHWVNDGLMVLFFFLLGLEVKREFLAGELRSFSQSSTVIMAALGGMLFPALIYAGLNAGGDTANGWAIPMATDAAFALGALVLLGSRIPAGLKAFLVALAIVDDIGAIIVIALFYTENLDTHMLGLAGAFLVSLLALNRLGFRHPLPYLLVSLALWYTVLLSGIHATIAGVVTALAIPARPRLHPWFLARKLREAASKMDDIDEQPHEQILADGEKHNVLASVKQKIKDTRTPLRGWENTLERPVSLMVVPIFAFLNAGIALSVDTFGSMTTSTLTWGVIAGLLIGKPVGITLMTWLAIKLGWGTLPDNVRMSHILALGLLAGMGFTMSIFIATLSFADQTELLTEAKASIMLATLVAGLVGIGLLWWQTSNVHSGAQSNTHSSKEAQHG